MSSFTIAFVLLASVSTIQARPPVDSMKPAVATEEGQITIFCLFTNSLTSLCQKDCSKLPESDQVASSKNCSTAADLADTKWIKENGILSLAITNLPADIADWTLAQCDFYKPNWFQCRSNPTDPQPGFPINQEKVWTY